MAPPPLEIGVDILEVSRVEAELGVDGGADFVAGLFTAGEIAYCGARRHPAQHYAARFAAKEALFKALGTGGDRGIPWREVEVRNDEVGRPSIALSGETLLAAERRGVRSIHVSLSHTSALAIAQVVIELGGDARATLAGAGQREEREGRS